MRQPTTIIVQPAETVLVNGRPFISNIRQSKEVDRFAANLAKAAGYDVPIAEGTLSQAPEQGFLFVYNGWDLDSYHALGPRIVLLDADRGALWNGRRDKLVTDRCQLAAAVGNLEFFEWQRGHLGGGGIHGLESVAKRAGMRIEAFRSPNSDYGSLVCHPHCHSLEEILVHYLTVYEEMGLHERGRRD